MTGHRPAALVNGDGGGGGSASRRLRCLCRPGCQQGASACAGACSRALARARVRVCSGNGDLYAAYAAAAPIARSSLALRLPLAVAMLHSTHVCARCGRCRARGESEREREREGEREIHELFGRKHRSFDRKQFCSDYSFFFFDHWYFRQQAAARLWPVYSRLNWGRGAGVNT